MKKNLVLPGLFSLAILLLTSCYNDNEYDLYPFSGKCDSTNASYTNTIAPIMTSNCNVCHSTAMASGGVITDNYAGLSIVAGNGKLWGGVNWESGYIAMPNGGSKLSDCNLAKIKNWINAGFPNN
jgi:hypothetical protein